METILDEHQYILISTVIQYRIFKGLIIGYAPGLLISKENSETELQFAQHIEIAYEFEIGKFHIGPMIEIGIETTIAHYMVGVHFGMDF